MSCFVCLETCNTKVCNVCTCYAHTNCWKEYLCEYMTTHADQTCDNLFCFGCRTCLKNVNDYELPYTVKCPVCKTSDATNIRITRSMIPEKVKRDYYIAKIKKMLRETEMAIGRNNKIHVCKKIFREVEASKHILLYKNPKFENTVKEKLVDFYNNDDWEEAKFIYRRLFNSEITSVSKAPKLQRQNAIDGDLEREYLENELGVSP